MPSIQNGPQYFEIEIAGWDQAGEKPTDMARYLTDGIESIGVSNFEVSVVGHRASLEAGSHRSISSCWILLADSCKRNSSLLTCQRY